MDGLDTGFFFAFKNGYSEAVRLYEDLTDGRREVAVSSVTVFELLRHGLVGRLDRDFVEETAESVGTAFTRAGVDAPDVLAHAARIAHGMGLSMADALIAASLEDVGCERLHTSDSDFEAYEGPMQVVFL
jgi:predicted nucleic acid-binding protein